MSGRGDGGEGEESGEVESGHKIRPVCVCVRACVVCVVMRMSTCNNDGNMTTMQQQ